MNGFDVRPLLRYINPDESYETWIQVGMSLKYEGYPLSIWEEWSRQGAKYHDGECLAKWNSFGNSDNIPVTGATITQLAKDRGWKKESAENVAFNARLTDADLIVVDPAYIDAEDFREPALEKWNPAADTIDYLKALFHPDEYVSFVTRSFRDEDGKFKPGSSGSSKTCREVIAQLKKTGRLDMVIGSSDREAGAWVRINPMDGTGGKNANVTDYRYALVESDSLPIGKQLALIKELQLPAAALVYSGGKSVHAIVHIDADTASEYRERVDRMYKLCRQNGLEVDIQNKNPSRLSRLPGVIRGEHKQFLIGTNLGQPGYTAWVQWMEEQTDNLPDFDDYADFEENLPPLAPELIEGILRQGHKMLISGPSKAGKSFALIELAIAITEGKKWFGFQCHAGNVLYINLEIDRASCLRRIHDVYEALGITPGHAHKLMVWNLRGDAIPMQQLAPVIIRRCQKHDFKAVIVDPIYKVITGDENAAGDMAKFCNEFDRICKALGVSCIYCHHHSKGAQGNKRAMDRASGSGVFARDPDALIDITPLATRGEEGNDYTGFRVSGILREFPPIKSFGVWFKWPIHQVDTMGVLNLAAMEGSMEDLQTKGRVMQTARKEARQRDIRDAIDGALERGEEITQRQLADMFNVSLLTIRRAIREIDPNGEIYTVKSGRKSVIERKAGSGK